MAKATSSSPKPKPAKKARIEEPLKSLATRVKGSPKPQSKAKAKPVQGSSVSLSAKGKGKQKANTEETKDKEPSPLSSTFKIVAGSYEKLLYGLEGSTSFEDDKLSFHLKPIFIFPAHVSCIKSVAASPNGGKWLATGSSDETVKVWDLRRKKEIGGLMHHEGSITHLVFPSRSHLMSASEDGTLCLFHARDWSVLRALKGHKGRVNSVAVHPSGKVALTVGKDRTLRMWDLMRGRGVASTKLGKEGEVVCWSTDGSLFIVQSGSTIDLYNTEMNLLHTINHPSRLHDLKFSLRVNGEGEILLAGAEDKKLSIYDVSTDPANPPKIIAAMVGHSNRIKAVQALQMALPPSSGRKSTTIVSTVSSDGNIHVYDLADLASETSTIVEIEPVAVYDTKGTRLTCVTLAQGEATGAVVNGKRKRKGQDDDESSEDEDEDEDEGEWGGIGHSEDEEEGEENEEAEEEEEEEEGEEA